MDQRVMPFIWWKNTLRGSERWFLVPDFVMDLSFWFLIVTVVFQKESFHFFLAPTAICIFLFTDCLQKILHEGGSGRTPKHSQREEHGVSKQVFVLQFCPCDYHHHVLFLSDSAIGLNPWTLIWFHTRLASETQVVCKKLLKNEQ